MRYLFQGVIMKTSSLPTDVCRPYPTFTPRERGELGNTKKPTVTEETMVI